MAFGLYELDVAQMIFKTLKSGNIFYDIGANAGYFTLSAAKAVGAKGKVVAFEPMAKSFNMVKEQIGLNSLEEMCRVEQFAVSDVSTIAKLTIPMRNANAHLSDTAAPHVSGVNQLETDMEEVTYLPLDSYLMQHRQLKPVLIKIDIEGAEVKALKGAPSLISGADAPIFLITAHSTQLANEVRQILGEAGYSFGLPNSRQVRRNNHGGN